MEDLIQEVNPILEQTEIIVMGDWNQDISSNSFKQYMSRMGMRDIIQEVTQSQIETQCRNLQQKPIDGIFATQGIFAVKAGYTSYGIWDHRTLWVDIDETHTLGSILEHARTRPKKRLRLSNPRSIKLYHNSLETQIKETGL